jgi:hypothetical protein
VAGGVYSTRVMFGAGAPPLAYTVPTGKRLVIKCVTAYNSNQGPVNCNLDIGGVYLWVASVPGNASSNSIGLMIVINAGETVKLGASTTGAYLHASGYLLDINPAR